jgi:ACS family hexuronate transporter-like MFS transporter
MRISTSKRKSIVMGQNQIRWFLIVWITASTVLNYLDRQTLSILAPVLRDQFHLTNEDYSRIVSAFLISYTVMYTLGGRFVDWIGERVGMAVSVTWWSIATMLHSLASGAISLGIFRCVLGIGEPANYPAALRATTAWFSKKERGLPIAIYSSGSALGAIVAPPLISWITLRYGWRYAFLVPGSLGLLWVSIWLKTYKRPVNYAGADQLGLYPLPSNSIERSNWFTLLTNRNVVGLTLARFFADPVWYFYLFWIPEYLKRMRRFSLTDIGLYGWIPFLAADLGGIIGGFASDRLIKAGRYPVDARRIVLGCTALIAPAAAFTALVKSPAAAIALIAIASFICFVWFINTAALVSDVCIEQVVGSVQGLIGSAGSGAGVLFTLLIGFLADRGSYMVVFAIAGSLHLAGLAALLLIRKGRESEAGRETLGGPGSGKHDLAFPCDCVTK